MRKYDNKPIGEIAFDYIIMNDDDSEKKNKKEEK